MVATEVERFGEMWSEQSEFAGERKDVFLGFCG